MPSPLPADETPTTTDPHPQSSAGDYTGKTVFVAAAALIVLLAVIAAAVILWPRNKATPPPATGGASPSPSRNRAHGDAAALALEAYNAYQDAYAAAAAEPARDLPLKGAGSPLRLEASVYLKELADDGLIVTGKPKHTVSVTDVNLTGIPHFVVLTDCFDNNGSKTIDKATGESRSAPGQLQRYLVRARAEKYANGQWLISTITAERKTPC
ncbi:hypothetical protein GCM10010124_40050 [Pilimelia terevasa]|uniref:Uncharacterized protein n=1 Tax=Pilimelia terevasa TaxID=53372 RepID=A0A8J3FLI3_9ACTN|nr:hypothetical protein [Pilimelia terevasa]GGK43251.1 hypothetical protein GCM10010124_40050 [Pilimelia terevasa]